MADSASANIMEIKHLSNTANDVVRRCAQKLDSSVDLLVEEFEREWEPHKSGYSKKLVEFFCSRALTVMCGGAIDETISNGSFSRLTFDMMLAWETPSSSDEESHHDTESVAKENEETMVPVGSEEQQDDVSLFYSDLMPLLVDREPSAGEDAFVWLGTLVPLVVDVVNGRFTFETLTASTGNRLHFPAYNKFLKEIHGCIRYLQKQETPKGVEFGEGEFILHVEGTANSQRVVRHIGRTSWQGRLTLTNYALYFEASGIMSYEDAIKLDLSKDVEHSVKTTSTGPWGAPLFDKAIVYESPDLQEGVVLEFPEMTSSTRRDHWLALVKEIMLLHKLPSKFFMESPSQVCEMHSRTVLGIIRLHSAREMLRISPPLPENFLIFALLDGLPKGDRVLEELAKSLKRFSSKNPCSASSILRNLNVSQPCVPCLDQAQKASDGHEQPCVPCLDQAQKASDGHEQPCVPCLDQAQKASDGHEQPCVPCPDQAQKASDSREQPCVPCVDQAQKANDGREIAAQPENFSSVETVVNQAREEAKEMDVAKASTEGLKDDGISESAQVLMGLLKTLPSLVPRLQGIFTWERPMITSIVILTTLTVIYEEWVGLAISSFLLWVVNTMMWARRTRVSEKHNKVVILTGSDQTTVDGIVSAQQGLITANDVLKETNVALLKIWSIMVSKAPKHTNMVMIGLTCGAITLAVIPFKFILIGVVLCGFVSTSKLSKLMESDQSNRTGNRRLWEWWDSIPIIPVEFLDHKESDKSK